jgi:hypothetical protein
VSDYDNVNAIHHSNRLPRGLSFDFPILRGQLEGIVKDLPGRLKAHAVLALVGPVLSFVPNKFHEGTS